MLSWTLSELAKFQNTPLEVDTTVDLKADLMARLQDILDASTFEVHATLNFEAPFWILEAHIVGALTVPSTRSLTPVDLPIDAQINEVYVATEAEAKDLEENEIVLIFEDGKFDLKKAIEDNIILSIPTQVLTPEEAAQGTMPEGKGWHVISENDYLTETQSEESAPNPEFAKLKDLFKDDKS